MVNFSENMKSSVQKGGLRTMPFIIANETFEKVASIGLQANMILYLIFEYHLHSPTAANILFLWGAISNFMPVLGAFLSDSYLGRFRVIAIGTFISLLGIVVLWLTAVIPQARPPNCDITIEICQTPKAAQLAVLFTSFALMSIGAGGIRPCSLAFGADQVDDPKKTNNIKTLQSFFNWYYASVSLSIMVAVTIIVYVQDKFGWVVGFGVAVILMFLSTALFLLGSSLYVQVKANRSLFTGFAQVVVVAFKNRHLALLPISSDGLYYREDSILFAAPTPKLSFLNKACMIRQDGKDLLNPNGIAIDPWTICTVQQVEEFKALIKVLPIWSTGIMIAVTLSQHSFPVLQASTMDRHVFTSNLKIPPASFSVFGIVTLTVWVAIYDRILVPYLSKFTKRPRGLSLKQRMGIGLLISCFATAVAGVFEHKRRGRAVQEGLVQNSRAIVNMSAMWLVPQHCLTGLAEAFNAIGQIEFYYSQFPKSMASIGVALLALGMAFGNILGSLIVTIVDRLTKQGGANSWVSSNLNQGHYDYYYWILSGMSLVNVFYFLVCASAYGETSEDQNVWEENEDLQVKLEN